MRLSTLLLSAMTLGLATGWQGRPLKDESRRQFLSLATTTAAALLLTDFFPIPAEAAEEQQVVTDRNQLLSAIARRASDDEVINVIRHLRDPSNGRAAMYPDRLDGQWELIWSYKAEAFSPLLKLPKPFKPDSYQYLGSAAEGEVGAGRISQGLTGGILGTGSCGFRRALLRQMLTPPSWRFNRRFALSWVVVMVRVFPRRLSSRRKVMPSFDRLISAPRRNKQLARTNINKCIWRTMDPARFEYPV
jgi:hypothetical protein